MVQAVCIIFFAGILYGLSLLLTQKVHFILKNKKILPVISLIRLFILASFFYIMLKSTQIHPIILIVSFFTAYWLTILKFKEFLNARS